MRNNKSNKKKLMLIFSFLGLYFISTGISALAFTVLNKGAINTQIPSGLAGARSKIDELPKDQVCPINGAFYTSAEKTIWEKRRPLVAMIENHVDSRPISGISFADVVYEAVAEGGITRFASVFYCNAASQEVLIAPVRSVRVYFIDWASEYGEYPLFVHVGGANDFQGTGDTAKEAKAQEKIVDIGWLQNGNDFDAARNAAFPELYRDPERLGHQVAYEHTMTANLDLVYSKADTKGLGYKNASGKPWTDSFDSWKFVDGKPLSSPKAANISFEFWEGVVDSSNYAVSWNYDNSTNVYSRKNGGVDFVDHETGETVKTSNVVVLFTSDKRSVDRNKHVLYTTIGQGDALVFNNGDVTEATWEKESRTARTKFYDESGKEIEFVRGKIWIEVLSIGNDVDY